SPLRAGDKLPRRPPAPGVPSAWPDHSDRQARTRLMLLCIRGYWVVRGGWELHLLVPANTNLASTPRKRFLQVNNRSIRYRGGIREKVKQLEVLEAGQFA